MVEKVVNLKVTDNVDKTTKSVGNLKTQLREAQNEVNELSEKFGATSEQAVNAAKRAAELKDAIGDAKALTDAFNPDAKFKALTSTLGGVAGGFSAVQGAVGLLGSESQSVEKAMLKVQSAMAISQGIQAIGESVDSFKQLGAVIRATTLYQKALAGATAVQTFVMNGATLAAKLLRGALIATGVGALVVGVGLLIANFDKVKKVVMNLIPGLSAVGDVVMSIVNTVTDFVGITSKAQRELDKMVSDSQKTLRKNQDFLDTQGDKYDEYTKRKIQANIDYAAKVKEVAEDETRTEAEKLKYLKDLRDKADRDIFQADKDRQIEKDTKAKEAQDKINDAEKTRLAKIKEANEAAEKEQAEKTAKLQKIAEEYRERQIKEGQEVADILAEAKKQNAESLLSEQELAIQNENLKFESDKERALAQGFEIEELELQHVNKLNDINLTAQNKKYEDDKAASEAKKELLKAEQDAQLAQMGAVANAMEGLSKIAGEKTKVGKALAIASATISTYKGIAEVWGAASMGNPVVDMAVKIASTAIVATQGIMNVKKIMSVQVPGGGGSGGGSAPSGSSATPPQFNIVGQSGTNQLAQTIAGQQNKPIEAFVVSSAVSTAMALDRNRIKTATFGG